MLDGSPFASAVQGEPGNLALLREQAWVGDAVLALFAREWLVANSPADADRSELFCRMTCNQFLTALGEPTRVEARIGRVYTGLGLQAAFDYIAAEIVPLYLKQASKRERAKRKTVKR